MCIRDRSLEEDLGNKISYRWLKGGGTLENTSLSHLPLHAQAAIEICEEAGISPMFLTKEYKKLQKSLKKFIEVTEKRGI